MVEDGYFRDQPRFERKDQLTTWSYIFLATAVVAFLWLVLLFWLMASERLADTEVALGLEQGTWVLIVSLLLAASIIGLFFVIVVRIGATQAGNYLTTGAETPRRPRRGADPDEDADPDAARLLASTEVPPAPRPARVEDALGRDGRMLLSYTVPEEQPRGVYGDTYVMVDGDQVLNVKTLLAKTLRDDVARLRSR